MSSDLGDLSSELLSSPAMLRNTISTSSGRVVWQVFGAAGQGNTVILKGEVCREPEKA
jgi:hypothetical protein